MLRRGPGFTTVTADGDFPELQTATLIPGVEHYRAVGQFDELDFVRETRRAFGRCLAITPGLAAVVAEHCIHLPFTIRTLVERHHNSPGMLAARKLNADARTGCRAGDFP